MPRSNRHKWRMYEDRARQAAALRRAAAQAWREAHPYAGRVMVIEKGNVSRAQFSRKQQEDWLAKGGAIEEVYIPFPKWWDDPMGRRRRKGRK